VAAPAWQASLLTKDARERSIDPRELPSSLSTSQRRAAGRPRGAGATYLVVMVFSLPAPGCGVRRAGGTLLHALAFELPSPGWQGCQCRRGALLRLLSPSGRAAATWLHVAVAEVQV